MKKLQYISVLALVALFAASCSEGYLTQYPSGSTITEEQYQKMDNAVEGTIKGIYPLLYQGGGGESQDWFSQKSIDLFGDILCGDLAMNQAKYGWFQTDELMQTYGRRGTYWSFYYNIIRACNKAINAVEATDPKLEFSRDTLSDEQYMTGFYYAQLLTMRGWAYSKLCQSFVAEDAQVTDLAIPIYTEDATRVDTVIGAPRATVGDLYMRINDDLLTAINYFEAYNEASRNSKLEVNVDIARILLAYAYLNQCYLNEGQDTLALKYAEEAITKGSPVILPLEQLTTTGFNDCSNDNWLWGHDVTVENSTYIGSFFAHVDIYSYGYASVGDVKGIDQKLFDAIEPWDMRKGWWNNYYEKYKSDPKKKKAAADVQYAPDGKFYNGKTWELDGDKEWLSDLVYMRWELAYLIAAEAAARHNDLTTATTYLYEITDNRCDTAAAAIAAYATWQAGLTDQASVLAAIKHNWRIELWGEGYGLQTFRRYGESVSMGENHLRSEKTITPATPRIFTFELPSSELIYNPFIRDTETNSAAVSVRRVQ